MPRGGKRPNSGPKKGIRSRLNRIVEGGIKVTGQTPAEFLISVYQDDDQPADIRVRAATGAAPYIHRKQPQAIEVKGELTHIKRVVLDGSD